MKGKELWGLIILIKKLEADAQKFAKYRDETDDVERKGMAQGNVNGLLTATGKLTRLLSEMNTKKNEESGVTRRGGGNEMYGKDVWTFYTFLQKLQRDAQSFRNDMEHARDEKVKSRLEGKAVGFDMVALRMINLLRRLNS